MSLSTQNHSSDQNRPIRTSLCERSDFVETNPDREWRDVTVVKRPLKQHADCVASYREVRGQLENVAEAADLMALDRLAKPLKEKFQHWGLEVGDKVWDANVATDGYMYTRQRKWTPAQKSVITSREYLGQTNATDREVTREVESVVDYRNSRGEFHPFSNNCQDVTKDASRRFRALGESTQHRIEEVDGEEQNSELVPYQQNHPYSPGPAYAPTNQVPYYQSSYNAPQSYFPGSAQAPINQAPYYQPSYNAPQSPYTVPTQDYRPSPSYYQPPPSYNGSASWQR